MTIRIQICNNFHFFDFNENLKSYTLTCKHGYKREINIYLEKRCQKYYSITFYKFYHSLRWFLMGAPNCTICFTTKTKSLGLDCNMIARK